MTSTLPKAEYTGVLEIGNTEIPCAVLSDGRRVVSEHGITTALGSRSGASKRLRRVSQERGAPVPVFLAPKSLEPFIPNDLLVGPLQPITYTVNDREVQGFAAEALPEICNIWLQARDAGVLQSQQMDRAKKAEILMRGLATVGITALVDEATGYQDVRARNALEKILEQFIAEELRKWAKTFPDEFYKEMFRLRGWPYKPWSVARPSVIGKYTNDLVYQRLAPGVLDELKRKTPRTPAGHRKHRYFQWLTEDVGDPRLREHLSAVIALMKASNTWDQFIRMMNRALPRYDSTMELPLEEEAM